MADIQTTLADQFGRGIADVAVIYVPAIKRLAMKELLAFANLLNEKKYDEAKKVFLALMTAEELAAEKAKLADLAVQMANDNYEKRQMAQAIFGAILKAALGVLLSAAFL
jgi:hypothetical protein